MTYPTLEDAIGKTPEELATARKTAHDAVVAHRATARWAEERTARLPAGA